MRQQLEKASSDRQAYWKPDLTPHTEETPKSQERYQARRIESCVHCGTEYALGSRFCHLCGKGRESELPSRGSLLQRFDFQILKSSLGLSTASLVAFVAGIACLLTAGAVSLMYSAATLVDWQAIQVWRIEWMLASSAAFLAGILLKRS